ncbi:M23 family metallopeptidase [Streptomyces zagrosensis]|uniref:Murein DD-endopeptidase MepM/ murein hydrolase activator NlpD n=1 Tax=Streptomyces zagrosensis TaxID=1042984 RepID=A0A7W9Q5G2_9ACTN|nr:M23 family metallopeptidase [Streptomyces zagrosensis]MBB5933771.1 murein DD-endopeptidase MepM/ murein hydrolase activator NlpD [Streptomyces zagrosensis]
MASNRSALDQASPGYDDGEEPAAPPWEEPWEEWNPTAESIAPIRGKHRVAKQRGGTMARSGAVLGVGVIAAVGAGGMASAKERPKAPISMPDLGHAADEVMDTLPDADELPGVGSLISEGGHGTAGTAPQAQPASRAPLTQAGLTAEESASGTANAGEVLRTRILRQAETQRTAAETAQRVAAERAASDEAAADAARKKAAELEEKQAAEAEAKRKAAVEAERKAAVEAERKAAAERRAKLAASYVLPVGSYTLTSSFGQAGDMWSANHTGQDFAAPTGTPVKAVHGGTITQAGWAGSYGYRIVLTLDDGTEVWYCHLSSMTQTSGEVSTGDVIGRVGATGNVTGPHLHLEVRPGGGAPIDPVAWMRERGLQP